ncbi:MAG: hypothetical protein KGJ41_01600 [Rhodospirillales bacterium]|nr:hypothetical protein [Rhodospirillales bacterium]MDE2576064.1 hypothetical protein [Rhodospirillales bacterium]
MQGVGQFVDDTGSIDINGRSLKLIGVVGYPDEVTEAGRFLAVITKGSGAVTCELASDTAYECRADASNVRVPAGLVANGLAAADPAGPLEYRNWEADAKAAGRGRWAHVRR